MKMHKSKIRKSYEKINEEKEFTRYIEIDQIDPLKFDQFSFYNTGVRMEMIGIKLFTI